MLIVMVSLSSARLQVTLARDQGMSRRASDASEGSEEVKLGSSLLTKYRLAPLHTCRRGDYPFECIIVITAECSALICSSYTLTLCIGIQILFV